jgi:hypothetical protein
MRARDKAIIDDLARFRVMSRDQIAELHFNNVKNPITAANATLLRLYRQKLINRFTNCQPYLYFPADKSIKKNSAKISHFLKIVDVYIEMSRIKPPRLFVVEPKFSKGLAEPDIFVIWKGSPLFIEVQRSTYSEKVMAEKVARYEALFESGILVDEPWQPVERKVFPAVLVLTDTRYPVISRNVRILQASSIGEFYESITNRHKSAIKKAPR